MLRAKCNPVEVLDGEVRSLIADLVDTMYHHPGCVGLAAPQIGVPHRVFVIDVSRKRGPKGNHGLVVLVNPTIVRTEGSKVGREGCLSIPQFLGDVRRARRVVVQGWDGEGREVSVAAKGLEAVAVQHEMDHLDGILFIDKLSSLGRGLIRRKG